MPSAPNILTKRTAEKLYLEMKFDACLDDDVAIATIVSIESQNCGNSSSDLDITDEAIVNQSVFFFVGGGNNGGRYRIVVTITTSAGETIVGDGTLTVKD